MASAALSEWTAKTVTVLTCDGRLITGTLRGYDQLQNLVLGSSHERVYGPDAPPERVELGLFVVRGDNVAVIAECDGDGGGDVRAEPIREIYGNR